MKGKYEFTQNRELSWLKFNDRVLMEAYDETVPLIERLKFIAIFTSNLNEFFMIRVGSLVDKVEMDVESIDSRTGMTPQEQLDRIYEEVKHLYPKRDEIYNDILRQLRVHGIYRLSADELTDEEKKFIKKYYRTSIMPVLSPQIIDQHHPFPFLKSNSLCIATVLRNKNLKEKLAVVPVPEALTRIIYLPGNELRYIAVEDIILEYIGELFEDYTIDEKVIFSVTRNADIDPEDDAYEFEGSDVDFRRQMKKLLKKRIRLAPVRLDFNSHISEGFRKKIQAKMNLTDRETYISTASLDLSHVFNLESKISDQKKKALIYSEFKPQQQPDVDIRESIFKQIQKKDVFSSYPFDSMAPFLNMLKQASEDPEVVSIKITIYRLSSRARIVEYLCNAAENGKEVTVLIELRARFDEQNNIDWSERLEESGCTVIYGIEGYKVHSKICLITRKGKRGFEHYTQIGTGNYNEKTAAMYTDISIITADRDIGEDASEFFKNMAMSNLSGKYEKLMVAPNSLKNKVIECIDREIAMKEDGCITLKMNSVTDIDIIEKLKQASCAGVKINMIVRGICCIVPGIPDKTENIHVRNIVGRYLEHSRIYVFGKGDRERMYISSADFMTRNTQRRVEIACPVIDADVRREIHDILDSCMKDNTKARILMPDGNYVKVTSDEPNFESQQYLMNKAMNRNRVAEPIPVEKEKNTIFKMIAKKALRRK